MTLINAVAAFVRGFWTDILNATTAVYHNPLLLLVIVLPVVIVGGALLVIKRAIRTGRL